MLVLVLGKDLRFWGFAVLWWGRGRAGSPSAGRPPATELSGLGAKLDPPGHNQPTPAPPWTQERSVG
jgi:hypothetical protein